MSSDRFVKYHSSFEEVLGSEPSIELLCDADDIGLALFHEACVYHHPTRSIFVTSNQLSNKPDAQYEHTSNKHVKLFRIFDDEDVSKARYEEVHFNGSYNAMLNGGVNFGPDSLLFCAQGSRSPSDMSGIISVSVPVEGKACPDPQVIVSDFYGHPFNSVNDVVVHPVDGSIWFTDPSYGYHQGIRNKPVLPNQVYRFDPKSKTIQAVADGFVRPNGLCFSPDFKTMYVTDTGAIHGSSDVPIDLAGPSHIYAFDVWSQSSENDVQTSFLANRRLFAYAPGRFPDGIKCDTRGNVYAGCGDGIEVWNPMGMLMGTISIEGGVANFCFGADAVIYACNESRLWKISLNQSLVKGALLGL